MCRAEGWDVIYGNGYATVEPHFCREYEDCGGGMDFDEACEKVAHFYSNIAKQWREKTHPTVQFHLEQIRQQIKEEQEEI